MSNTSKRIISGVFLILLVFTAIALGQQVGLLLALIAGILIIDEIEINFFKHKRKTLYWISQIFYVSAFTIILRNLSLTLYVSFWLAAMALNLALLYYLFFTPLEAKIFLRMGKIPLLTSLYSLLNFVCLGLLIKDDQWIDLLTLAILIASSSDTGAWFIGRKFGRTPLWPVISPKKTREGLYGGIIVAGFVATCFYIFRYNIISPYLPLIFIFLGLISQVGDLIKSKFKRQAGIKDSSSLIPGHGGVFDRLDSLIFLVPFYLILRHLYWK